MKGVVVFFSVVSAFFASTLIKSYGYSAVTMYFAALADY